MRMCLKSVVGGEGAEYLVEGGQSDNVEFLLPVLDGLLGVGQHLADLVGTRGFDLHP